jgi:hypothetical protein
MPTNPYPVKVYDTRPQGHPSFGTLPKLAENEFDRLQEFYKFKLDFTYGYERAEAGQCFWAITGLELKAGPAVLQPQVRDQNGGLIATPPGILLFLHWPGAEVFPGPVDPPYAENGVGGFTENKGSVGWGFGPESHIGPEGGPFLVWASSDPANQEPAETRRVGSDAVDRLGWWDEHIIPNPIFQVMVKTGGTTPSPTGTQYLVNVNASGVVTGHIVFIPGLPPQGVQALGLMRDGQVVGYAPWTPGGVG